MAAFLSPLEGRGTLLQLLASYREPDSILCLAWNRLVPTSLVSQPPAATAWVQTWNPACIWLHSCSPLWTSGPTDACLVFDPSYLFVGISSICDLSLLYIWEWEKLESELNYATLPDACIALFCQWIAKPVVV